MRNTLCRLWALAAMGLACSKSAEPAPAPAAEAPADYKVIEVANGGVISGTVKWTGPAPMLEEIRVTKDPATCGKSKKNARLIVGKAGGVADAYVYVAGIKAGAKIEPKDGMLEQRACEYVPHAQAVPL